MQEIEFDPKIFKNSNKYETVRKDLLDQLKCRGADTPAFKDLVEDYMAGITSEDYTIKLTKADKRDVAQYINDSDSFNFEGVYEIEEKKQLSDYELEF